MSIYLRLMNHPTKTPRKSAAPTLAAGYALTHCMAFAA
jgi:hypothetical protein